MPDDERPDNINSAYARVHLIVSGRVQGVGFRYFTVEAAHRYDISGWTRNTHNREVEITAEGKRENLEQFIQSVRRGPSAAFVQDVKIDWFHPTGEFLRFSVLAT